MPKRYVRGDRSFKQLIDRLPDAVRQEIIVQLNLTGRELLAQDISNAPVATGSLKAALTMKVLPASLKLKVGLVGKAINRQIFYALMVEYGRKGGGRGVKRGSAKYASGIGATIARHFVYNRGREAIYEPFKQIWTKALARASSGVSDG